MNWRRVWVYLIVLVGLGVAGMGIPLMKPERRIEKLGVLAPGRNVFNLDLDRGSNFHLLVANRGPVDQYTFWTTMGSTDGPETTHEFSGVDLAETSWLDAANGVGYLLPLDLEGHGSTSIALDVENTAGSGVELTFWISYFVYPWE